MTVKELIAELKKYDMNEEVWMCNSDNQLMRADRVIQPNETNSVTIMPE